MKVIKKISTFISALLHPFFLPTIALFILFALNTHVSFAITPKGKQFILILVFFNTAIVPMLLIFLLNRMRIISSLSLRERKDRVIPLILGAIFYVINYFLLLRLALHPLINFYLAGATIVVIAALIITIRWKISIHMMSMGAISGFFYSLGLLLPNDVTTYIAASFILSGVLGSARLIVKAHHPSQVFVGYMVGFATMMLLFLYVSS
jgi:membrane-associated phospholipid phosphatase